MFQRGRGRKPSYIACIFVHAGAGYHSVKNEHVHLSACNAAARSAMAILKNGGSAVDAVEIAVKILEDREITNAGYGSNLSIDGTVECDAVVVDHLGRSGAVGAVAQIKNPISLARLVLDQTTRTLSLRRVPPNLLVSQGATEFAWEKGMPILPHDCLISPNAKERWQAWRNDLERAQQKNGEPDYFHTSTFSLDSTPVEMPFITDESEDSRQSHVKAMLASIWNEAQPISPPSSDSRDPGHFQASRHMRLSPPSDTTLLEEHAIVDEPQIYIDPHGPPYAFDMASHSFPNCNPAASPMSSTAHLLIASPSYHNEHLDNDFDVTRQSVGQGEADTDSCTTFASPSSMQLACDGSSGLNSNDRTSIPSQATLPILQSRPVEALPHTTQDGSSQHSPRKSATSTTSSSTASHAASQQSNSPCHSEADRITDTVGAIAIDMFGNIACGASSGGIGMKHRGRVGPAALVGIGAAVVPVEAADEDQTTVATVTSGTGEHIGTTTAAGTCSERLYSGHRKLNGGRYEECGDDEAIHGFIDKDFMEHPSVKHSHSTGAIGVLTVKKTRHGAYLYFGHNTESFAVASMRADDAKPAFTMSRKKADGTVAQGGRAIRYRKARSTDRHKSLDDSSGVSSP